MPYITQALTNAKLTGATPALAAYAKNSALVAAVERLASWDLTTPTGLKEGWDAGKPAGWDPSDAQVRSSTAATIYAVWRGQVMHENDRCLARTREAARSGLQPGRIHSRDMLDRFATLGGVGTSGVNFFVVPNVQGPRTGATSSFWKASQALSRSCQRRLRARLLQVDQSGRLPGGESSIASSSHILWETPFGVATSRRSL